MFRTPLCMLLLFSLSLNAQQSVQPYSITYRSKTLMANSVIVHTKDEDSIIVEFRNGKMFSMSSYRPQLSHLTDTRRRVRFSAVNDKHIFKLEKVNPDTTNYVYTYVKLPDTIMIGNYVGYRRRFTMKDKFTGVTFTVVLYECPEIKIDPEYSKYFFSELFFMKVPIRFDGAIIKALAEQRIDNKPVSRDEIILSTFNNDSPWPLLTWESPIEKNYTMMLPDGNHKERQYAKELLEELTGRNDYPTTPYRVEFDHY